MKNTFNSLRKQSLLKLNRKNYSSKKHNTNFDYNLDWLINSYFSKNFTVTKSLLVLNAGIFAYCWLRPTEAGRYLAQRNTSFSSENLQNRDYINMFASLVGSRKVEDFVFDSAVLLTIGTKMEKIYGSPFIFKLFMFSFYMGYLSSIFWVRSNYAKNERYRLEDPKNRDCGLGDHHTMKFSSMHGTTMAMVYFYLFSRSKLMILPVAAADMYIWGPYYSNAMITGLGFGMVLL